MPKQKESERIAKIVIESVVRGATMSYREHQANGEHDYDLRYPNGLVVPVEVTESADFQIESAVGTLDSQRFVKANSCHHDWYVHPLADACINTIRSKADQYLAAIEQEGLDEFFAFGDAAEFPSVRRILEDLRIESGSTIVWSPPGRIGIAQPSQEQLTPVNSSHVQKTVELEVSKQDNLKKLALVDASERHLFIVVHPRNYATWVAVLDSNVPSEPPLLPNGITDVWVVAPDRFKDVYVVWRCTAGQDWRDLGRITI